MFRIEAHLGLDVWTSSRRSACLAFADAPGYRLAAGEPQCPQDALKETFAEFEEDCRRKNRRVIYFGLPQADILELNASNHRGVLHLGDIPVFNLRNWEHLHQMPREIRSQMRRAMRHGVTVRHVALPPSDMSSLQKCLSDWLRHKGLPPMGFATTPFLLDPWPSHGIFVAETKDRVCGFLVSSHSLHRDILRIDAVVRIPHAPNGTAELLVAAAFQDGMQRGLERATLDLAPLSAHSQSPHLKSPLWFTLLAAVARHLGSPWYSFGGLEAFKAKFHPDSWQSFYCVSQSRQFPVRDFIAVLRAFAGGSLMRYARQSLLWKMGFRSSIIPKN